MTIFFLPPLVDDLKKENSSNFRFIKRPYANTLSGFQTLSKTTLTTTLLRLYFIRLLLEQAGSFSLYFYAIRLEVH